MKSIISRVFVGVFTASLLAACGSAPSLLNRSAGVGSFAAPANQAVPRSNAGLDTISKRMRTIMFNQQDANHDGILHRHELTFIPAELYTAADKNKDGMWDVSEFLSFNFDATSVSVPSREVLRKMAQNSWSYYNKDANAFVTLDEVMQAMLPPTPTSPPPCQPPNPGFKCPVPTPPGPPSPYDQQAILAKATTLFNSADRNLDRKLNMSEFEDMNAKGMLDSMESPYSNGGPGPVPVHPSAAPTSAPCDGNCPAPRR